MEQIDIRIAVLRAGVDELSDADRRLVEQAKEATSRAYAPYSHFRVGAAALLGGGGVVTGANQENAAFPSGLCAERTALFAAQAAHPEEPVVALAIAARDEGGFLAEPVTPCGACRQVMLGVEGRYGRDMRVLLYGTGGVYIVGSARDLLPLSFSEI